MPGVLGIVWFPFLVAIGGWFGTLLASSVARFLALKIFLTLLFVTVLPIVLNNFFYKILEMGLSRVTSATGEIQSFVLQLSGLSAFFASHLQLVSAVSILLSALSLRFTLKVLHVA